MKQKPKDTQASRALLEAFQLENETDLQVGIYTFLL